MIIRSQWLGLGGRRRCGRHGYGRIRADPRPAGRFPGRPRRRRQLALPARRRRPQRGDADHPARGARRLARPGLCRERGRGVPACRAARIRVQRPWDEHARAIARFTTGRPELAAAERGTPGRAAGRREDQVANTRHDRAGGGSAGPRRGPQAKLRARERIAAERAARKRAEARRRFLAAIGAVAAVPAIVFVSEKNPARSARPNAGRWPSPCPASAPGATSAPRHHRPPTCTRTPPRSRSGRRSTGAPNSRCGRPNSRTSRPPAAGPAPAGHQAHRRLRRAPLRQQRRPVRGGPVPRHRQSVHPGGRAVQPAGTRGPVGGPDSQPAQRPVQPGGTAIDGSAQVIIAAIDQVLQNKRPGSWQPGGGGCLADAR